MLKNILPLPTSAERNRISTSDDIRKRALQRLYERQAAVNELIESLENYARCQNGQHAACSDLSGARRYSSGCAQWRT